MICRSCERLRSQGQRFFFFYHMKACFHKDNERRLSSADTLSTVILGGASRGVTPVAAQGAVGAGAGGSPLTGGFFPFALEEQTHGKLAHKKLLRNKYDLMSQSKHWRGMWARLHRRCFQNETDRVSCARKKEKIWGRSGGWCRNNAGDGKASTQSAIFMTLGLLTISEEKLCFFNGIDSEDFTKSLQALNIPFNKP